MLEKALNKQIKLAAWHLAISVVFFLGIGLAVAGTSGSFKDASGDNEIHYSNFAMFFIGMFFIITTFIAGRVLWILGIVGAINVNSLTGSESTSLVVFSIITLFIGHLIAAILTRSKYRTGNLVEVKKTFIQEQNITPETLNNNYEYKLKQAFMDGFISSNEYEKKLKEHRNK